MRFSSPVLRSSVVIALCAVATVAVSARPARAQDGSDKHESSDKPFAAYSASAQTLRDSIVAVARAQIGTRYRTGGESPKKGFDCSGLVQYVMSALDLSVPRTARLQAKTGLALGRDTSQLLPGDLLTFGKGKKGKISHVGIYVGDGRYVHASSVAGHVIESSIDRPYSPLIRIWRGARRILTLDDSASAAATARQVKGGQ
ncbi:MAG TPA: C40 family peptidase [Gemmatimonadaceae bacterium]|nr:C40 family peptidase [Gemmatimonadaceae bacterium]